MGDERNGDLPSPGIAVPWPSDSHGHPNPISGFAVTEPRGLVTISNADPTGQCDLVCIGGIVAGAISFATGVGEFAVGTVGIYEAAVAAGTMSAETVDAIDTALAGTSIVSGGVALGADANSCAAGQSAACVGAFLGGGGVLGGGASLAATYIGGATAETVGSGASAIGLSLGLAGVLTDTASAANAATVVPSGCTLISPQETP
jgi:hypothetical protein